MDIKRRFGLAVKRIREQNGWSQEEIASRLKKADQAYISRVEAGQVNLSLETIEALAAALHVDLAELFAKPPVSTRRQQ